MPGERAVSKMIRNDLEELLKRVEAHGPIKDGDGTLIKEALYFIQEHPVLFDVWHRRTVDTDNSRSEPIGQNDGRTVKDEKHPDWSDSLGEMRTVEVVSKEEFQKRHPDIQLDLNIPPFDLRTVKDE